MGEAIKDWKACRDLVRSVTANYRIPYITISPTFSVCSVHGYLNGEQFECPKCKAEKEQELRSQLFALEKEREEALALSLSPLERGTVGGENN
jgi:ribonucleoside-triphosphate reductase